MDQVLGFLATFHAGIKVIIADGSQAEYSERYAAVVSTHQHTLEVDYRRYPAETPYIGRILDVLKSINDPYVAMGSDDDFPNMDVLDRAQQTLDQDASACVAIGTNVNMKLRANGALVSSPKIVRDITGSDAKKRIDEFQFSPFPTTYSVARTSHLIQRYLGLENFLEPSVIDLTLGLLDCVEGSIRQVSGIGYFITRNFNHSYVRQPSRLSFLNNGPEIFSTLELVGNKLANQGHENESETIIANAFARRISGLCKIALDPASVEHGQRILESPIGQAQVDLYQNLFRENNPTRDRYIKKLRYIVNAMIANSESDDNKNDEKTFGGDDASGTSE